MKTKRSTQTLYGLFLLSCDIAVAIGSFLLGLWLTGWNILLWGDVEAKIGLVILSLTSISFFQSYHLYSFHFLFSRKTHLKTLVKSFCWSGLTLVLVVFLFNSFDLLRYNFFLFLIILLCGAIVLIFLSRYFWNNLLNFLMAFSLAIFFVGMTGMACKHGVPLFMTHGFVISICFLLSVILLTISRLFLVHVVFNNWLRKRYREQIAIVGSGREADRIVRFIMDNNAPFWVVGTIGPHSNDDMQQSFGKEQLGTIEELSDIVERFNIDDLIITDETIDKHHLVTILDYCTSAGINAWFSPKQLPIINVKLFLDNFCGLPMILLCSQKNSWLFSRVKRAVDILLTIPLFILLSPLFLLISLAIKLDSAGPVFYRPEAIGKDGMPFLMYKFRSMRVDSDHAIHKDYVSKLIKGEVVKEDDDEETPLKITNDPRVTKVGKVIRKFSLDELPQLINVLRGDMSLVGPRPCLPYEFEMYLEWYKKRASVRGGITGLWQVAGRSEVSFEDMILLDIYYIYNRSLALDLNILFETFFVVLAKKGAY